MDYIIDFKPFIPGEVDEEYLVQIEKMIKKSICFSSTKSSITKKLCPTILFVIAFWVIEGKTFTPICLK